MNMQNPDTQVLTGTIRVVGNEPFSKVVLTLGVNPDISTIDQQYLIVGPLRDSLRRSYQGKKLTLEGELCTSPDPAFKNCFNPAKVVDAVGRSTNK
ncbi:MAG: hypothetical protein PHD01_17650 [Geobacteraceae bacterium]|nr:hypothetical protein [Geobacteraceae bacterium]